MKSRRKLDSLAGCVICCVGAVALCVASCAQGAPQASRPVVTSYINTEYQAPPPTLREMALAAGAVVRAKAIGSRPHDKKSVGRVQTAYRFQVIEVIHDSGSPVVDSENTLEVLRSGGDRVRYKDTLSVVDPEFPQFRPGTEYVLFLAWNPNEQLWVIMWGPSGLVQLVNGRAHPWSKATPVAATEGRSATEVLDAIRLLKNEGGR